MPILSTLAFAVRRGRQCVFSTPRYLPKREGPNAGQGGEAALEACNRALRTGGCLRKRSCGAALAVGESKGYLAQQG